MTTTELIADLRVGADVLARERMFEFPKLLRAAADRLEALESALEAAETLL